MGLKIPTVARGVMAAVGEGRAGGPHIRRGGCHSCHSRILK